MNNFSDIAVYAADSFDSGYIDEVHERVSATSYRVILFASKAALEDLDREAIFDLKRKAFEEGANAIVGVKTSITFLPGFFFLRGCAVHATGTPVMMKS